MVINTLKKMSLLVVLAIAQAQFVIADTYIVLVKNNSFDPNELIIKPGDRVRWKSDSGVTCDPDPYGGGCSGGGGGTVEHKVTADDFTFSSGEPSTDISYSIPFREAGEFLYHCEVHSEPGKNINAFMNGRIIVESEASAFQINAGLNDAWVSDEAALQGFFFTVFEDLELFFLSWFTFDSLPPDPGVTAVFGAPDQRWVTGAGNYNGDTVSLNVELTSGGIFNTAEPAATQSPGYGTITIVFISCNEAVLTFDFPSVGLSGQMTLTRVVPSNVALCETLTGL